MKEALNYISVAKLRFFRSPWSALLTGPIYGVLLYLYIAEMVLKGAPFTDHKSNLNSCPANDTNHTCQVAVNDITIAPETETILEDHVIETRPNNDDYFIETRPNGDDYLIEKGRNRPHSLSYKEESKFAGFIDVDYNSTNLVRAESRYKPRFKPLMSVQTR